MAKDLIKADNILGEGSTFKGRFHLRGNFHVDGKYEGDSLEVDNLYVGKTGKIKSAIRANNVMVEGIVIGSIHSNVRTLLYPSAKILGDIHTPELIIQNGVIFEGKCHITNKENESSEKMIETLYSQG